MGFENVCKSLNAYFSNNKYLAPIQAFALPATFVCAILMIVSSIPALSLSWFYTVLKIVFYLCFFMLLGTENFLMVSIALALRAVESIVDELVDIFKYNMFSWSAIIYILVFGFLAYIAYMKSLKGTK